MRKIISILFILIIFMYVISIGCIQNNNNTNNEEYKFSINFLTDSINSQKNNYMILPFPINNNEINDKIIEMIKSLNINFSIENTIYGLGINISFNTEIQISINGKPNMEMVHDELSLLNGTILFNKGNYWFYSTINGSIEYLYRVRAGSNQLTYKINNYIVKGWQIIEGKIWDEEVD